MSGVQRARECQRRGALQIVTARAPPAAGTHAQEQHLLGRRREVEHAEVGLEAVADEHDAGVDEVAQLQVRGLIVSVCLFGCGLFLCCFCVGGACLGVWDGCVVGCVCVSRGGL